MSNLTVDHLNALKQVTDLEKVFHDPSPASSEIATHAQQGTAFLDFLDRSFDQVNLYQKQADVAIGELVAGRNKNIHETMLTLERADASLKLLMQVRNKILDAYREIMRMQV